MAKGFLRHAPGGPEAINSASFDDDIADTSRTYVIEFWSAGCAACERIAGVLEQALLGSTNVTISRSMSMKKLTSLFAAECVLCRRFWCSAVEWRSIGHTARMPRRMWPAM